MNGTGNVRVHALHTLLQLATSFPGSGSQTDTDRQTDRHIEQRQEQAQQPTAPILLQGNMNNITTSNIIPIILRGKLGLATHMYESRHTHK